MDKEIEYITDESIVTPNLPNTLGNFETVLPGVLAPMRLRKMYTRTVQLRGEVRKILEAHGLIPVDETDEAFEMEEDIPMEVLNEIYPIAARANAMESAIAENVMAEHNLWNSPCIILGNAWEIYYRTHEQEDMFQAALFSGIIILPGSDEDFGSATPFDPSLN